MEMKKAALALAPMAGVGDRAFREVCAPFGVDLFTSEMISAKALTYGDKKSVLLADHGPSEAPFFLQLFGSEPAVVGEAVGIDEVFCALLPQEKVEKLKGLLNKKEPLFYVGDGINDAPVIRLADVGVAMGGLGSDAAIEAADIVVMDDDIRKLPLLLSIAKKTRRIVTENVVFALGVKLAVLALAALGIANMWLGVLADVGVAVLCILNSMRMLKK